MRERAIVFEGVTKRYGEKTVLNNISFSVMQGEFVSIIGSSGCGKTTLLRMVNGLVEPEEGNILVCGEAIATADIVELRRRIGYVIQEVGLFPHMCVRSNIEYVPGLLGKKRREAMDLRSAEELMDIVGLDRTLLDRYPAELSGGQRQRVGLARALATSPPILLMDEAFASVDEITRKHLQREMKTIHVNLQITILFVTHSVREAMELSDRLFILDGGKLVQEGTPAEVRQNPSTDFVANLINNK